MPIKPMDYWKLYRPSSCKLDLSGGTKEEVFDELIEILVKAKALPEKLRQPAKRALVEREALASTGIGLNVAIPHVKLKGLEQAVFSLALHPDGVEWSAVDGEPVSIFFAVLRPDKPNAQYDPERHREMMGWISNLARVADFRRFALRVKTRTELVDLVKEMSARIQ